MKEHFNLIEYTKPEKKDYIILESLNQVKENNNFKSIHVITLEPDSTIVIGRGHDADVRVNDISVSRIHGTISISNNRIYLKDLGSKFGTLALIQRNFECLNKKVCLQIGRSYIETRLIPIELINEYKESIRQEYLAKKE